MKKYYVFFVRDVLPKPAAYVVQIVNLANAAANLGYSTVLVSLKKGLKAGNPIEWLSPFHPTKPDDRLAQFYNLQNHLKIVELPIPWPIDAIESKWTSSSTIVCKYYFPRHILPHAQLVHSRDWNFVQTAIQHGIPAIYERDHCENKQYDRKIVGNPLFQAAVTVAAPIRDNLIENGIPPEKVIQLHNGFNQLFLKRQPEKAEEWRKKLLGDRFKSLAIYAGALYDFKGIDMTIEIANQFPEVKFVMAGGPETQVEVYRQITRDKKLNNVELIGYLAQNPLASFLQAADILLYPHLSGEAANFTSPMKLFDYIAAGVPIVATRIPPLKEFQDLEVVAAWCEPDNPQHLARGIQQVLEQHSRPSGGYSQNFDRIGQFSWETRILKTLDYVDTAFQPPVSL
ncbi:MAG: glycosyltransferase [Geitlerinemataceae cyanobacterium]